MGMKLTGNKRYRAHVNGETVLVVLQVEFKSTTAPVCGWRDARVEDITEGLVCDAP